MPFFNLEQELQTIGVGFGLGIITDGAVKFTDFYKKIVGIIGNGIRPFTKSIYLGIAVLDSISDEIADQMDDAKNVRAFDINIEDDEQENDISDVSDDETGSSGDAVATDSGNTDGPRFIEISEEEALSGSII